MLTSHTFRSTPARAALALVCLLSARANAECPYDWQPGDTAPPYLNGGGYNLLSWDPDGPGPLQEWLVAGGSFTMAGQLPANRIAAWDGTTWHAFGTGLDATPSALAVLSGQLFAATHAFNPAHIAQVLRWDGSNWQPLGPGFSGHVYALTEFNGDILAAGDFGFDGIATSKNIVRWDGSQWQPLGDGMGNGTYRAAVYTITVYGGDLIAGGSFASAGGVPASCIARWDGQNWHALGEGLIGGCNTLVIWKGNLFASTGVDDFAEWNGDAWLPIPSFPVDGNRPLVVYDGNVISAGDSGVARWNGKDWQWLLGGPDTGALAVFRGDLIAWGGRIVRWNGAVWEQLIHGSGLTDAPLALMEHNGELIAGGWFTTAADISASFIAGWNGSHWRAFGSGMDRPVYALKTFAGDIIAGGSFTMAGGSPANGVARWNGAGWEPIGAGIAGSQPQVRALTIDAGNLIAGGSSFIAGNFTGFVSRWDGSDWQVLDTGLKAPHYQSVDALLVHDGSLFAGGRFRTTGSAVDDRIARWDGDRWQPVGAGLSGGVGSASPGVYALASFNGDLIAAGNFTQSGNIPLNSIARWNGIEWRPLGTGMGPTYQSAVFTLTVYNDELIAGGHFLTAGGVAANRVARWNGVEWRPLGTGLDANPYSASVSALLANGNELIVGGFFLTAGKYDSAYIARWGPTIEPPAIAQQPARQTVALAQPATFQVAATGGQSLNYQWRKNGTNLIDNPNLTGAQTDKLTIASATSVDTGQYDCQITNDCGNATTTPARLTVLIPIQGPPQTPPAQPATND